MPPGHPEEKFTLHPIRLLNVSCFLYYRGDEAMLIDCGNAGSEEKILKEMQKLGLAPDSLRLLILTHTHFDHAGSAGKLKELTGCKIMLHKSEAGRLLSGYTPMPRGTRWKAKVLVGLGSIFARRMMRYPPAVPDLELEGDLDLATLGFDARVIHCPGHSPGSLLILTGEGNLISGDTFFGLEGKQHFPPFAEDLPRLLKSWKNIRELDFKRIYPAHGRSFSREAFLEEYETAMERYSRDRI